MIIKSTSVIETLLIFLLVFVFEARATETSGNCSASVQGDKNQIVIDCRYNNELLTEKVRRGKAVELIEAMNGSVSPELIMQAFGSGASGSFAGIGFFNRVKFDEAKKFLITLSEHVNFNNKIKTGDEVFSSILWMATDAGRSDIVLELIKMGVSPFAPYEDGQQYRLADRRTLFPHVHLFRSGVFSVSDKVSIDTILSSSPIFPEDEISSFYASEKSEALRMFSKIFSSSIARKSRKLGDMHNLKNLCALSSKSENFDWCNRIKNIPLRYQNEGSNMSSDPQYFEVIGIINIRDGLAFLLIAMERYYKNEIGILVVPKRGHDYRVEMYSGYTEDTCFEKDSYRSRYSCWRSRRFDQDPFEEKKFKMGKYGPIFNVKKN